MTAQCDKIEMIFQVCLLVSVYLFCKKEMKVQLYEMKFPKPMEDQINNFLI